MRSPARRPSRGRAARARGETDAQARIHRRLLGSLAAAVLLSAAGLRLPIAHWRKADGLMDLRYHELSLRPDDAAPPVVLLGGSESEDLERFINERLPEPRVYNLASAGGNTLTMLAYFKLALRYRPGAAIAVLPPDLFVARLRDMPVVLARPALLQDMIPPAVYAKILPYGHWSYRARAYLLNPVLMLKNRVETSLDAGSARVRGLIYGGAPDERGLPPEDPYRPRSARVRELRRTELMPLVQDLRAYAAARGVRTFFVLPPFNAGLTEAEWGPELSRVNAELRAYLRREGIPFLDCADLFSGHPEFFDDGYHLGAPGKKIWARLIVRDVFRARRRPGPP